MVQSHLPLPKGSKEFAVKFHKATDNFDLAMKFQGILEQMSDIPSTDAIIEMNRWNKRKPKLVCHTDFTEEEDKPVANRQVKVDIEYSPPPPPLLDMSNYEVSENIQPQASSSFLGRPSDMVTSNKENVTPTAACSFAKTYSPATLKSEANMEPGTSIATAQSTYVVGKLEQLVTIMQEMHRDVKSMLFHLARTSVPQDSVLSVKFPVESLTELQVLNERLQTPKCRLEVLDYLSAIGGPSFGECTRNILKTVFSTNLASSINWRGVNNKTSISGTPISLVIIDAVMSAKYPGCSHASIREKIQRWIQRTRRTDGGNEMSQDLTSIQEENFETN